MKLSLRYLAALERHREVGHPEGYDGPCWGPTAADFAFVDGVAASSQEADQ